MEVVNLRAKTHRVRSHEINLDTLNRWKGFYEHLLVTEDIDLLGLPLNGIASIALNAYSDYLQCFQVVEAFNGCNGVYVLIPALTRVKGKFFEVSERLDIRWEIGEVAA